jgi:hypothetical protein
MVKHRFILYAAIYLALAPIACGRTASGIPKTPSPAPTPLDAAAKPVNPASSPTATPEPVGVWIQPGVPQSAAAMLAPLLADPGYVEAPEAEGASVRLVLDPPADASLVARWVLVPVAPFPTVPERAGRLRPATTRAHQRRRQPVLDNLRPASRRRAGRGRARRAVARSRLAGSPGDQHRAF